VHTHELVHPTPQASKQASTEQDTSEHQDSSNQAPRL
jgi:hypothetical protein